MISCVTETVAEIEARPAPKENFVPHTWCVIEEIDFEGWGIRGNAVTPDRLKAVLEGKAQRYIVEGAAQQKLYPKEGR